MKILIPILLLFIIFGTSGVLIIIELNKLFVNQAKASEQSPLDFITGYDNFAVTVGIDKRTGRYATYHYEFSE
jgi:hypothetical protein